MIDRRTCLCDRYCKCAWCTYLFCLFAPILALLILLGWGLTLLVQ